MKEKIKFVVMTLMNSIESFNQQVFDSITADVNDDELIEADAKTFFNFMSKLRQTYIDMAEEYPEFEDEAKELMKFLPYYSSNSQTLTSIMRLGKELDDASDIIRAYKDMIINQKYQESRIDVLKKDIKQEVFLRYEQNMSTSQIISEMKDKYGVD